VIFQILEISRKNPGLFRRHGNPVYRMDKKYNGVK